jgi:AcrR family transcriptional regulator
MPYPRDHKAKTRAKIVQSARALFNRRGFDQVTIDEVMAHAGLTRGGFYHHFESKEGLYREAVASVRGNSPFSRQVAEERARGVERDGFELAHLLVDTYLAEEMLTNVDDQCPLYALSNDVARAGRGPRVEYTKIVERMATVFAGAGDADALPLAAVALCVGGMVLARTTNDASLAKQVRLAARDAAHQLLGAPTKARSKRANARRSKPAQGGRRGGSEAGSTLPRSARRASAMER